MNMLIDEKLRKHAYFFIDKLKGGIVEKLINNLDEFYALSPEKKIDSVNASWRKLHTEVTDYVPFYKDYKSKKSLSDFPVINKKGIAYSQENFHSSKYDINKLVPVRTSGSYGTPLTYYLTVEKKKSQLAEVIYYGRKCGYDVGIRHGYFRSNSTKSSLKLWMQNESFFASKELSKSFLMEGLNTLKSKKIKTLIGFPSSISYLAKYCIDKGFKPSDFGVTGVITQSENLTKYHREVMYNAFNCEVHNRYSTEEFGVLGNEYELDKGFDMNCCNYIIEVLKLDKDESVGIGEVGRVVVTDLHSNAMPLIRYETGDLAVLGSFLDKSKGWVNKLAKLSGRSIQILYSTNGTPLYPLYLDSIMESYECFAQHQLIQNDEKDYELKLVANNLYNSEVFDMKGFKDIFYNWLGFDAQFDISFVDDIEKLPSGKRPYIINRYKEFSI